MKNILELTGVQKLTKQQQRNIKGAIASISCCGRNKCRISYAGGSFCEPGRCTSNGGCIIF